MELLTELYTDPSSPAAFAGVDKLYKEAKQIDRHITRAQVLSFLEGLDSYSLHKPRRIRYKRRRTIPVGLLTDFQADLADLRSLAKHNNDYYYILVCVDVLSRRIFAMPVKRKTAPHMKSAFTAIFKGLPANPHSVYTDKG